MRVTHSAIKSLMVLSHAVIAAALTLLVNPSSAQGPGDPWSRIVQPFFRDMEIGEPMWKSFALEPYGEWSEFADECIDPKPTLKDSNGLIADC